MKSTCLLLASVLLALTAQLNVVVSAKDATVVVKGIRGGRHRRTGRKLKEEDDDELGAAGNGLLEVHTCEPDPQRAIDYVDIVGYPEEGDMDCYADPVNACDGGCCRFATYFICDTDNFAPHLACVCNVNTAPLPPTDPPTSPAPVTAVPATPAPAPAPTTPAAGGTLPADGTTTTLPDIVDTAIAAGAFSTLVDLVTRAGLTDALRGPGPLTVFAPVDAAFPQGEDLQYFLNTTSPEALTSILLYHVLPGEYMAGDLTDGASLTTLQGSNVTITLPPTGPKVNQANITQTDIDTSNGVIHVIDGLLLPPPSGPDIVDTAIADGSFTTLVDLVARAGLVDTLRGPGPFTLFAPNDEAFPQGQELADFIANTDLETLTSILTYHVVPGIIRSTDLADGLTINTVQGGTLTIELDDDEGTFDINDADILLADIEASNGIIHVIDEILMPSLGGDGVTIERTP